MINQIFEYMRNENKIKIYSLFYMQKNFCFLKQSKSLKCIDEHEFNKHE
jgi:hypothetical protein